VTLPDTLPFPFFSFDTSAFINGQRDLFKPKTFGALWDEIARMIQAGTVLAVDEVKRELRRKDDDVARWARSQRGLFVPLAHDIQQATRDVLAACPRLMAQHGASRNSADPFVVGLALARGGTVVTQETPASSPRRPRVPDACVAVGVPWRTLPEFVDEQHWRVTVKEEAE
jgi:predicted nucleic acid-binding protein